MKTIDYYMSLPYHMEIIPDKEIGALTVDILASVQFFQ